jgi:hypothetical protein
MLEQETELILKALTERTIGAQHSIRLEQILASGIPNAIKVYLRAEVEQRLQRDLRSSPTFERLDDQAYSSVEHLMTSFLHALSPAYSFNREEFHRSLDHAVHFAENYLCRPRWTLEHFIFDEAEFIPLHEFLSKLQYFSADYRYFGKLLEQIARRKGWIEIHVEDIRLLIARIDEEVIKHDSPSERAMIARPIFDFLLLGEDPATHPIPVQPLLVFYSDKQLRPLRDYIEVVCRRKEKENLTLTELTRIVEEFYPPESTTAPQPQRFPTKIASASPGVNRDILPVATSIDQQASEAPSTGGNHTEGSEQITPPLAEDVAEPPAAVVDQEKRNLALSLTFAGMKESRQTPPLPDLNDMIGQEFRERFIKEVFGKDETRYLEAVAALNEKQTWREASTFLKEFYESNALDPFADDVVEFTDAIHRRYVTQAQNPE